MYPAYLYAIKPNGGLKWKFKVGDSFLLDHPPAIGSDGTVYVGSGNGYLYAIKPDGTLKWKYKTEEGIDVSSPAIGSDGTIYAGSLYLYAIKPDGTLKWKSLDSINIFSFCSPAIGSDGMIYVGGLSHGTGLYAISPGGALKWLFKTQDIIVFSSPAIGSDGTVYVGSDDGYLYAINSSSKGLAKSSWPMLLHDIRHTGNKSTQ